MTINVRTWYLIAALSPALLALVTVATKSALTHVSNDWFLFLMFTLSLPFLAPWRKIRGAFAIPRQAWPDFLGHTFFIGAAWVVYTAGIALLPAAVAVFVSRIEGIFIILLAVMFLKENFGRILVLAAILSFAGIAMIDQGELNAGTLAQSRLGIIYVVGGALSFAAGEIFAMRALKHIEPKQMTFLRNVILSAAFLLAALRGGTAISYAGFSAGFVWILMAAVAGPVLARVLHLHCIKHIPLSHAAIMTNTEPVFGVILGFLVFSEMPGLAQHAGAVLICGGVALSLFQKSLTSAGTETRQQVSYQIHP